MAPPVLIIMKSVFLVAMISHAVSGQTIFGPLRINCGGSDYIDPTTRFSWKADTNYVTKGRKYATCGRSVVITNTTNSLKQTYCSHRYFDAGVDRPPYTFNIPVLPQTESYIVRLHFAELFFRKTNERKMDVLVEGVVILDDLDVIANVGFRSAYVFQVSSPIVVSDGVLNITMTSSINNAMISGIEVLLAPKPVTNTPSKAPTTSRPTIAPLTNTPTKNPTMSPTEVPVTNAPTKGPTSSPTMAPITIAPTSSPTNTPITNDPTKGPTSSPTKALMTNAPTLSPTNAPITNVPTKGSTTSPIEAPITSVPTKAPTAIPATLPTGAPITNTPFVYFYTNSTDTLGVPNVDIAIGNPLKGLAGGPRWAKPPLPNSVPSAIEFYNMGLDEIMIGDNEFNWTLHNQFLNESASRKMHAVISVYIHWPGRPLRLPLHLKDLPLFNTSWSGQSPNYGDARLLTALRQFIFAWSEQIDGDTRIAALHVGLLGFWGEGHTYPDSTLVPESSKVAVAQWFRDAFNKTQVQTRYPGSNAAGFGLYDGSLAYNTLDGAANGGKNVGWFQYPRMIEHGQTNIWKEHMMGGETRPELQGIIFTDTYPARTENHQDYKECVDALHISYAVHHNAFKNGGYTGNTLLNANKIHAYMGYAFYVSEVAAITTSIVNAIDVSVSITQLGVAPFYYDLSLVLQCNSASVNIALSGVNEIVANGDSRTFTFESVPATSQCLNEVKLSLQSTYAYQGRPIVFAQGTSGNVTVSIPFPSTRV